MHSPAGYPSENELQQLADECQAQNDAFRRLGRSDPHPCLRLFRLALEERVEAAWGFLFSCYSGYLRNILSRYREFGSCDEEVEDLMQQTIMKFSQSASYKPSLPMIISYLKRCAKSVVIDCHRRFKMTVYSLDQFEEDGVFIAPAAIDILQTVHDEVKNDNLWKVLLDFTNSEIETVVVYFTFHQGLKPRYIHQILPDLFDSPGEVSRIRDNFLKRLKKKKSLLAPFWLES